MIRLLDKKTLSVDLAIQKKKQIDQGVNLAKKVDAVRETLLEEEKRLAEFRNESIARTQTEIDAKIKEKNFLESEIKKREKDLTKLREPLDAEWEDVNSKIRAVNTLSLSLNQMQGELEKAIALNIQRERLNKEEEQRIAKERERSVQALTEADLLKEMTSDTLTKAKTRADTIHLNARKIHEEAERREQDVDRREVAIVKMAADLKRIEKEQKRKDKEILDKYETLNRDIERIHGKRRT